MLNLILYGAAVRGKGTRVVRVMGPRVPSRTHEPLQLNMTGVG